MAAGSATLSVSAVPCLHTFPRDPTSRSVASRACVASCQSAMWRWLFDAYRLLGIHLEIIDDSGHIVTPPSSASAELRNAVSAHRNVEAFLTHETRASMVLAGMSVSSTPIVSERAVAGAVLIAVRVSDGLEETDLARVGSALAKAIAEQLSQSAHDRLDSLHKISALLSTAAAPGVAIGSESAVLRTFAEALSIWEDLVPLVAHRADTAKALQSRSHLARVQRLGGAARARSVRRPGSAGHILYYRRVRV